jgi:hypothetical protein
LLITDPSGNVIDLVNHTITDPNGNQIAFSLPSQGWTDTLGASVLTTSLNGSQGTTYSYPGPGGTSGVSEPFSVTDSALTIQTNFRCPGIADITNQKASLPTSISLPDGTLYGVVYEATWGTYPSNFVTGRIHSLTLPSGATVTYTYTGGTNGINCLDGSPAILTKTTPDGPWKYNRSYSPTTKLWTTIVTDPSLNDTAYTFDSAPTGTGNLIPYTTLETQRVIYQGSHTSGSALETIVTCYNGNFANCATTNNLGPYYPYPITRTDKYTYLAGNSSPSLSEKFYAVSNELQVTQDNEFDFGVNTGVAPTATPLKGTMITYASLGNNILNRPACVQVTTGNSPSTCGTVTTNTNSITKYLNYSAQGNVGTIQRWISGSTYATSKFTYYPTGLVETSTDPKNNSATYTYADCNNSYLTNVAEPLSLSTSMTWDCNGGVPITSTDENGQITRYVYQDHFGARLKLSTPTAER